MELFIVRADLLSMYKAKPAPVDVLLAIKQLDMDSVTGTGDRIRLVR
jgi:hypothetical protein